MDEDLVITEEQKLEFYNVIDYNADKEAIASSIDLPKDVSQCNRLYKYNDINKVNM